MKAKSKERIILGIDPGTSITGYGVIKTSGTIPVLITIGSIDLSKYDDHYLKLKYIFERTIGIIDEYHPDELAIEAPFYGAKAWQGAGRCNSCSANPVIANIRICTQENQNVNNRAGSGIKGAGSSYADEYTEIQTYRNKTGCNRWSCCSSLPFLPDK